MLKTLLKIRLASFYAGLTGASRQKKKQSGGKAVLFLLLMVYCVGAFFLMFYNFFSSIAGPFAQVGLAWLYFAFFGLTAFALMFIGSVFTAKAQLFEARDNELLLSMPVRPRDILGSRMVSLLAMNFFFELLVALPAVIAWLASESLSAAGWISYVVIVLALPFLAQAFSCLVAWLISLLTSRVRNKSLMTTLFSLAFLGAYFYFFSQINTYITRLVQNSEQIAGRLGAVAPVWWLGDAVANGNLLSLAYIALLSAAAFALLYGLLTRSFIRIVTAKRGFARIKYERKSLRVSTPGAALLRREFGRLLSSPDYMLNAGLGLIFIVGGAIVLLFTRGTVTAALARAGFSGDKAAALFAMAVCLVSGMVLFTAPSVSLEGKTIWVIRSLPVETISALRAKQQMSLRLLLPCAVLCSFSGALLLRPDLLVCAELFLVPAAFAALSGNIGLIANLRHPNLNWINETQAVKQGISVLITMLVNWAVVLAPGLVYLLLLSDRMSGGLFLLLCLAVYGAALWLTELWIRKKGVRLFEELN